MGRHVIALAFCLLPVLASAQTDQLRFQVETYANRYLDWVDADSDWGDWERSTDLSVYLRTVDPLPDDAVAYLSVPAQLGLGRRLTLTGLPPGDEGALQDELDAMGEDDPEVQTEGDAGDPGLDVPDDDYLTTVHYGDDRPPVVLQGSTWQSSELVDDPLVRAKFQQQESITEAAGNVYWWPDNEVGQAATLEPGQDLGGTYLLTADFTGPARVAVPAGVRALEAFEWLGPDLDTPFDWGQPITLRWRTPAGARAVSIIVQGQTGDGNNIIWTSAQHAPVALNALDLTGDEADQLVAAGWLLAPDADAVTIPAGLFVDCPTISINLTAWGGGATNSYSNPQLSIQTRSYLGVHVMDQPVG